jgi:hypothetical protein
MAMVVSASECPHGLALPLVTLADAPADNALAIEQELEEHVLGRGMGWG